MILELISVSFGAWLIALILFHKLYKTKPVVFHAYSILLPCTIAGLFIAFVQKDLPQVQVPPNVVDQVEYTQVEDVKNWTDAEKELRNNLIDSPHDIDLIKDLSGNLIAQEKFTQAANLLRKELKNSDNEDLKLQLSVAQFAHGLYLAEHKKYDKAITLLDNAKKDAPLTTPFLADIDAFIDIIQKEQVKTKSNTEGTKDDQYTPPAQ